MSNILSRIQEIAINEGITIGALERIIGASKGVLSRAISNGTDIQSKWLQKIVENYPHYSANWILTGEGSMLKSEIKGTASPNTMDTAYIYNMYEDYKKLQEKVLAEKERRIKELETKLAKLEQQELSTTSSDFHAEIAKKKRSSSRISGPSAQPDAPTIK